jgi:hypothetical protein
MHCLAIALPSGWAHSPLGCFSLLLTRLDMVGPGFASVYFGYGDNLILRYDVGLRHLSPSITNK